MEPLNRELRELALLHSIQLSYRDANGRRTRPGTKGVLATLRAMGAPLETVRDVPNALALRREELCAQGVKPVTVWWEGAPSHVRLTLPFAEQEASVSIQLTLEGGGATVDVSISRDRVIRTLDSGGKRWVVRELELARPSIPFGYHTLTLAWGRSRRTSMLIHAPARAYSGRQRRAWGVFAPVYGLRSSRNWGIGDLTDLAALIRATTSLGGSGVATLPLLATFLYEPFEPSPYAPVSRLFWNEIYLDPTRIQELSSSEAARQLVDSAEFQEEAERLRSTDLVDYRGVAKLKRRVLDLLATEFFEDANEARRRDFEHYVASDPRVDAYARFRAAVENGRWPDRPAAGTPLALQPAEEPGHRFHLFCQWQAVRQMESVAALARSSGFGFYLDFPLGVHGGGFDAWSEGDLFVRDASAGAPPDPFFQRGQNWGFPPMHPDVLRRTSYRYFIDSLRTIMRYAGILRFDHVMAMHRLFWIPRDLPASDGVYVRYETDETFAILAIESHRHRTVVVGENLGIVPAVVQARMNRHGVQGMYVLQYEIGPNGQLRDPQRSCVASLNTHDMPPFNGFFTGKDIDERARHGHVKDVEQERRTREATRSSLITFLSRRGALNGDADAGSVCDASLEFLARSDAELTLVNAEDLWLATEAQNLPGTHLEHPNWQRKLAHEVDELSTDADLSGRLRDLDTWRRQGRSR